MLAFGNYINHLDSYSGETVEITRGVKHFNLVGLATVNPAQPSREIPFMIPSRQRGREPKQFIVPSTAIITRVSVLIPKDVIWQNPENPSYTPPPPGSVAQQSQGLVTISQVLAGIGVIIPVDPYGMGPATPQDFDTYCTFQRFPGMNWGRQYLGLPYSVSGAIPSQATAGAYFNGDNPNCSLLSWDSPVGPPASPIGSFRAATTALWIPNFNTSPTLPAPTTSTGKKSAIILEVSGFAFDFEPISLEKALAGVPDQNQ
jgi:hypothetical protein